MLRSTLVGHTINKCNITQLNSLWIFDNPVFQFNAVTFFVFTNLKICFGVLCNSWQTSSLRIFIAFWLFHPFSSCSSTLIKFTQLSRSLPIPDLFSSLECYFVRVFSILRESFLAYDTLIFTPFGISLREYHTCFLCTC